MPAQTPTRPQSDEGAILAAIRLLAAPDQVVELRALNAVTPGWPRPHTVSGYFNDLTKLAHAAAGIQARGVYVTLNVVQPDLLARAVNRLRDCGKSDPTTADENITARRWLLIDCDAVRPSGISANDAERAVALARARDIRAWLTEQGWPQPIYADSGNGAHLLYRVDLPVAERGASTEPKAPPGWDGGLVQNVLRALAFRFDDALVIVDQTCDNPARISKLYGTPVCKGDPTPERPHRLARILEAPVELTPVPQALLAAVAAMQPPAQPRSGSQGHSDEPLVALDVAAWLDEHNLAVSEPKAWQGGQRWVFETCPWNSAHTDRSAYVVQFANGAIAAGCHHNGCQGRGWRDLRDAVEDPRPAATGGVARSQGNRATRSQSSPALTLTQSVQAEAELGVAVCAACAGEPDWPELAFVELPGDDPDPAPTADDLVEEVLAAIDQAADREAIEDLLPALTQQCLRLNRNALLRIDRRMRKRGLPQETLRAWHSALSEQRRAVQASREAEGDPGAAELRPPTDAKTLADFAPWVRAMLNRRGGNGRPAREVVGCALRAYLIAQGRLLFEVNGNDAHRTPYLLTDDYRTIQMAERGNLPLAAALAYAGLNASEPAYDWTIKELVSAAYNQGRQVIMHRFAFADCEKLTVYVSCGIDGYVVARPGQPLVYKHNADDGIIFNTVATFPKWDHTAKPVDFRDLKGFRPPLLTPPEAPEYTVEIQRDLLYSYLLGVFSGQRPLPLGMFIGGKGGGKSTSARSIVKWLMGRDASLGTLGSDPRDLTVRAVVQVLVTFDNLDTPPEPWALDAIAACVTGVAKIEREFYTNTGLINIIMQAALLATTRTAPFSRPDIVERILPFFTDDPGDLGRVSEDDIYDQIEAERSGVFVYIASLTAAMLTYRADAPAGLPGRFVDFARLVYSYYAAYGESEKARPALLAWRRAHTLAIGDPDPLLRAIVEYLPASGFRRVTATELVRRLSVAADQAGDAPLPFLGGGKAIARQVREIKGALEQMDISLLEDRDEGKGQALFTIQRPPRD
jgi:hypothetical protein